MSPNDSGLKDFDCPDIPKKPKPFGCREIKETACEPAAESFCYSSIKTKLTDNIGKVILGVVILFLICWFSCQRESGISFKSYNKVEVTIDIPQYIYMQDAAGSKQQLETQVLFNQILKKEGIQIKVDGQITKDWGLQFKVVK